MSAVARLKRALTRNVAETSDAPDDPRLRGRAYAIPFEDVWRAAHALAGGKLHGWRIVAADDREGIIEAEARTLVFRFVDDVTIRIRLDEDAQTRVDVRSASRKGRADLGANARRIARFFRALDRRLRKQAPRAPLFSAGEGVREPRA